MCVLSLQSIFPNSSLWKWINCLVVIQTSSWRDKHAAITRAGLREANTERLHFIFPYEFGMCTLECAFREHFSRPVHGKGKTWRLRAGSQDDDDCFYYLSWINDAIIAFGTLSSFLTWLHIVSGVVCVVCPFALRWWKAEKHSCRSIIIGMSSYLPQYPRSSTPL